MNNIELKTWHVASVSGGKDSLYMMKLLLENPDKYPLDAVIHAELDIDWPFVHDCVDRIEDMCRSIGIKMFRLKPVDTYENYLHKYGLNTQHQRWCNKWKLSGIKRFEKYMLTNNIRIKTYIGLCANEERRFKEPLYLNHKYIYPIAEMGIHESEILEWAKGIDVFDGWYETHSRQGCMFCPFLKISEMRYMARNYPNEWKKFTELIREHELKTGRSYFQPRFTDRYFIDYYIKKSMEDIKL